MRNRLDKISINMLTEVALRIANALLGTREYSIEWLHHGMMTFKCRVRSACDDVIIRFYPTSRSTLVNLEPDLISRCRRAGLPVPHLIGDSRDGPSSPLNYMVYHRIEGETLADTLIGLDLTGRAALAKSLAQRLNDLQSLTFAGAGELITCTTARDISWESFVQDAMQSGIVSIRRYGLLSPELIADIEQVISSHRPMPISLGHKLVWGDINFGNIIVGENGLVAGLIDFEGCLSGDPLATIGYAAAVHGTDPFFTQIRQAVNFERSEEVDNQIAWYALLRALRIAIFAHLPLPTGRPRDPFIKIVPGIVPALRHLKANI